MQDAQLSTIIGDGLSLVWGLGGAGVGFTAGFLSIPGGGEGGWAVSASGPPLGVQRGGRRTALSPGGREGRRLVCSLRALGPEPPLPLTAFSLGLLAACAGCARTPLEPGAVEP